MAVLLGLAVVLGWDNSVLEFLFSLFLFLSLFLFQSQMYFWKLNSMSNLLYKGLSAAVCFLLSFTLIRQASKWCEKHFSLLLQLMQMCCLGTKRSSSPERNILRWSPWQKGGLCSALQSIQMEKIQCIAVLWSTLVMSLLNVFCSAWIDRYAVEQLRLLKFN